MANPYQSRVLAAPRRIVLPCLLLLLAPRHDLMTWLQLGQPASRGVPSRLVRMSSISTSEMESPATIASISEVTSCPKTVVDALIGSRTLCRVAQALLCLKRSPGGCEKLDGFVRRAVAQLDDGRADWQLLLGPPEDWQAAGVEVTEAEEALKAAQPLLTLGTGLAHALHVNSSSPALSLVVTWLDWQGSVEFAVSPPEEGWGHWASCHVKVGPPSLLGRRLVAMLRASGEAAVLSERRSLEVMPGDVVFVAEPDRAAILELASYDQMPEFSQRLAEALRDPTVDPQSIVANKQMREAATFLNSLDKLSAEEEFEKRFQRLKDFKLVRDLHDAVAASPSWSELMTALRSHDKELYRAERGARQRRRPVVPVSPKQRTKIEIQINVWALVGLVIVAVTVVCFILGSKPASEAPGHGLSDLPLFTLKGLEVS